MTALSLFTATETDAERSASADYWEDFRTMLANGLHVLAYGPPGTGKTFSALYYATDGRASYRHTCKPSDTAEDVLGRVGIVDGSTRFERGAGAIAVETGARFVFDEIDRASEDDYAMLYALADGKPFLLADGSVITPHPRLQIILTTNMEANELFPMGSGIADRFVALFVPEPSAEALETLPEVFRESARRAVRSGITGFRAWQHLETMLRAYGFAPSDLLHGLTGDGFAAGDGNGLRLPEAEARERMFSRLAVAVFGPNGSEVLRAFRVAACRDEANEETKRAAEARASARARIDAYVREAYEAGRSAGLAEGLAVTEDDYAHDHDRDACPDCEALWYSGHDCGTDYAFEDHYCDHDHDSDHDGTCNACDSVWETGYEYGLESAEHDHDRDHDGTCSACDYVWETGYREALEMLENVAEDLIGAEDAEALAAIILEESAI